MKFKKKIFLIKKIKNYKVKSLYVSTKKYFKKIFQKNKILSFMIKNYFKFNLPKIKRKRVQSSRELEEVRAYGCGSLVSYLVVTF